MALGPVAAAGVVAAAAIWVAAPELARTFLGGLPRGQAVVDIRIIAPLVPLGALSACLVDATRGFGRRWPYLAIEGLGRPVTRIILVLCALLAGLGLRGAVVAWGLPVAGGLAAISIIFVVIIRSEVPAPDARRRSGQGGTSLRLWRPSAPGWAVPGARRSPGRRRGPRVPADERSQRLGAEFWRFTGPRAFQGIFQVTIIWLNILLVGAMISQHAAGIYAAVSKLALVGAFALEGTRLAISPQVSAFLARGEPRRAAALYHDATRWLMLATWPLYLVFAIFPAVVLGLFGSRYTPGAAALAVLSLAMLRQHGHRQRDGGAADGRQEFLGRHQHRGRPRCQHRP